MSKLTVNMRVALSQARTQPLRRVHDPELPGRPPWPVHPSTLAALINHGHLTRGEHISRKGNPIETWTITDTGRQALNPPRRRARQREPLFLAAEPHIIRADYTRDPRKRMPREPDAVWHPRYGEVVWLRAS